jgi:hypothetical protein
VDEPWLFDRAMAMYQYAFRTGDVTFLREAHRGAQFYANHISPQGYFDLKGDDIKYVTGEAIATDYWLTGDARMLDVQRLMIPEIDRGGFNPVYTPGHFWTERHAAYKLLGYTTGYELLGDPSLAQKAHDLMSVYIDHQNNPPAGATYTGMLMHLKPDHGEGGTNTEWVASPWMSVLLADTVQRYYVQSGDARVPQFITRLADGVSQTPDSMYYTSEVDGVTRLVPHYMAGPNLTDAGHELNPWDDAEHGTDVSKIFALAYFFARQGQAGPPAPGSPAAAYLGRFNELQETSAAMFNYWTRPNGPASGLSVYRLTPARKYNWWFRTTADRDFLIGPSAPATPDTEAPHASVSAPALNTAGGQFYTFTVTYTDNRSLNAATMDNGDMRVTGPGGYNQMATLVSVSPSGNGAPRVATYRIPAPGGTWDPADDGTYDINILPNQVADVAGNFVTGSFLMSFGVHTTGGGATRTLLGAFGLANGRSSPLKFVDPDGTSIVASLRGGGTGQAFLDDGQIVLELSGTSAKSMLALKGKGGGDGRISLGDVHSDGAIRGVKATTADLFGTLYVAGAAGSVTLGTINGGTIATAGDLLGLSVKGGVAASHVLAGVNLGTDGVLGGGDDSATAASIRKISLGATTTGSIFAAGVVPGPNGVYGDADDIGTGATSAIRTFSSRGIVDATSRLEAGSFGRVTINRTKLDVATDARCVLFP